MPSLFKHPIFTRFIAVLIILAGIALLGRLPSTKLIMAVFIVVFLTNSRTRIFLFDFAPFLLMLLSYDMLRNFADDLTTSDIHITDLIHTERALFGGHLPNTVMQEQLWGHWYTPVLDTIANTLYLLHFLNPLILAALLWNKHRDIYWSYAIGLIVLAYAAFITYMLVPAAPPWWAREYGYLPHDPVSLSHFILPENVVRNGPNPVAAIPSLHSGFPFFIAMVSTSTWGKRGLFVFILPVMVSLSTVYLGHHYVIDALLGYLYATVIFCTVFLYAKKRLPAVSLFARNRIPATGKTDQS